MTVAEISQRLEIGDCILLRDLQCKQIGENVCLIVALEIVVVVVVVVVGSCLWWLFDVGGGW